MCVFLSEFSDRQMVSHVRKRRLDISRSFHRGLSYFIGRKEILKYKKHAKRRRMSRTSPGA